MLKVIILSLFLVSCAKPTYYKLCIPSKDGNTCHPQEIETHRQIERVEISYNGTTGELTVILEGVRADPIADGVGDLLKRVEIMPIAIPVVN